MTTQPIRPHTLWERLCTLVHVRATEPIPHWEHLRPPDLPRFDVPSVWAEVSAEIARLPLDEGHADVADRLVQSKVDAFCEQVKRLQQERHELLTAFERQGIQHMVTAREQVARLRWLREQHQGLMAESWEALCGAHAPEFSPEVEPRSFELDPSARRREVPDPPPPTPLHSVPPPDAGDSDDDDPAAGDR